MIRKHLFFHGRVQGVGFRYKARMAAEGLRLTGWVRNLDDGRVECEVQGNDGDITRFIKKLQEDRFILISGIEQEKETPDLHETSFKIKDYYW